MNLQETEKIKEKEREKSIQIIEKKEINELRNKLNVVSEISLMR